MPSTLASVVLVVPFHTALVEIDSAVPLPSALASVVLGVPLHTAPAEAVLVVCLCTELVVVALAVVLYVALVEVTLTGLALAEVVPVVSVFTLPADVVVDAFLCIALLDVLARLPSKLAPEVIVPPVPSHAVLAGVFLAVLLQTAPLEFVPDALLPTSRTDVALILPLRRTLLVLSLAFPLHKALVEVVLVLPLRTALVEAVLGVFLDTSRLDSDVDLTVVLCIALVAMFLAVPFQVSNMNRPEGRSMSCRTTGVWLVGNRTNQLSQ